MNYLNNLIKMAQKNKRVLLKLSWEALAWEWQSSLDDRILDYIAELVKDLVKNWIEVWIVIWWGNIFRWISWESAGIDRVSGDYMWMLATLINWLALVEYFTKNKVKSKLMTSTQIDCVWERFEKNKAIKYLEDGKVVVFAWWTWNPYFTTDTWGVLRALEIEADMIIKATKVDWVYSSDPKKYKDAIMFEEITYDDILEKNLKVMDSTAIALARDWKLVLKIVNLFKDWSVKRAILWEKEWTIVK